MSERIEMPGAKNLQMMAAQPVVFLYCDLSKDCGTSSSGKSVLISSSCGNKPLGKSGAFLGLNIFTKSLEKRDLSSNAIAALRTPSFTDVGVGCQWRIEEDEVTLCIRVDCSAHNKRLGASGKSMLLATTGGNKLIGGTGLSCGLNCYYPVDKPFDVSQLAAVNATEEELQVGQSQCMGGGFTVSYKSPKAIHITYIYRAEEMTNAPTASLPPCRVGDLKMTMFVSAPKGKRTRTERAADDTTGESPPHVTSSVTTPLSSQTSHAQLGSSPVEERKDAKLRNLTLTCTPTSPPDTQAAMPAALHAGVYTIDLCFDPTLNFGRTSSGKSLAVATTGGFQQVFDADGRVVCRLSLNAYRPAPPLTEADITAAVQTVLETKPKTQLSSISFKDVLNEVMGELGLCEAMKETVKQNIKEAVVAFVQSVSV
ncbi:hypothetical protein JKF63_03460 [Porcisia hertigi]|uniref:Uncharacterized protein n=1 Tax=Porcisia hertigi TaxID=2761500 RepID=A0A836IQS9_9TRYP|nr:hypothetical protein JKF63_03460 [Porcisia hertigi]